MSLKGFAGVGLSDNAGSDWADVTFGEHAIVNFAEPPSSTRAPNFRGSPVGLPLFMTGRHFGGARDAPGDGGNRPPFACAFDGRAAPTALDENGGVSSALHRCEVPPRETSDEKASDARRTSLVLPPGEKASADGFFDDGARATWSDVPWTRAGAVTVNGRSLRLESFPSSRETRDVFVTHERARFEDGGDAFVAALVSDDDDDDVGNDAVSDFLVMTATAHVAVGCAFGATRVEGRAEGDHKKGAVFCASPAAKRPGGIHAGQGAFFGVGARFAERMTVQLRGGGAADATRDADREGSFAAIVGRRGSLDVSSLFFGGPNAGVTCAVAIGDSGGWVSGSSLTPLPRFPFFCDTPIVAAERAGFVAVRASLGAEFFDGAGKSLGQISARAAPAARGAAPSAAAAGGESVNVPVFVTGKDLPGAGETAWCVARGGAFGAAAEEDTSATSTKTRRLSASFVPAIPVSSALVLCPPPDAGGVVSGDFSSSPARLEIVPVDVAAGTPTGGAFYAKSSVEMDVEAHGGGPPGAAGEMEVGGGGGGAATRFVPEEGGATVFVRPGGARVAPSGCDFGTIVGVSARHAHARMDEKSEDGSGVDVFERGWFACASPAMRARRVVPTRAAFPSRSRRDADDVGHVAVRRSEWIYVSGPTPRDFSLSDRSQHDDVDRVIDETSTTRLASPAAATWFGGSPTSISLDGSGGGVAFCVFAVAAAAGFEARRVVVPVASVISATLAKCETPPAFSFDAAAPRQPPDVARGGVAASSVAGFSSPRLGAGASDRADAAPFAWVAAPAVFASSPRSGTAEGGVLVSVYGTRLSVGARPAAWFGVVGPVACRVAGDADEVDVDANLFVFASASISSPDAHRLSCVSPASAPTRRFAGGTPAPLAASATGDAQTRSAFGGAYEYVVYASGFRAPRDGVVSGTSSSRPGFPETARFISRAPETRRVVAPAAAPVGGGAVLWLAGSGFRNGATEREFRVAAGFAFADASGAAAGTPAAVSVGACVPFSSALAACEAPARAAPTRRARARFAFLFAERSGVSSEETHGNAWFLPDDSDAASLAVAAPASVSRVSPAAVPAAGGAAVMATLSAAAAASARLGCAFGTAGPVAGRFAAETRDALSCVAPAHAPSRLERRGSRWSRGGERRIVPVAATGAGSGAAFAWADAGVASRDVGVGVFFVGGDASSEGSSPFGSSAESFAVPFAVAANARASVRVFGAGAHFLSAAESRVDESRGDESSDVASAACVVGGGGGGADGSAPSAAARRGNPGNPGNPGLGGSVGFACDLVPATLGRLIGFRAAWVTWGALHGGGDRFRASGLFEMLVASPPRVVAAYPAETAADGGGVAFVVGSFGGFSFSHGQTETQKLSIVFGAEGAEASRVVCSSALVNVVSAALARVETPDFFKAGVGAVTGDDGRASVGARLGDGFGDALLNPPLAGESRSSASFGDIAAIGDGRKEKNFHDQHSGSAGAGVLVSRRRPIVVGLDASSARTLSPAGGAVVSLAGDALASAVGGCACFFGTVGPVAAACVTQNVKCAAPATRPRQVLPVALLAGEGGSHLFARRPPRADALALDAAGSGAAVAAVSVGGAGGEVLAAMSSGLASVDGEPGGVVVYGWGLDAFEGDAVRDTHAGSEKGLVAESAKGGARLLRATRCAVSAETAFFDGATRGAGAAEPPVVPLRVASGFVSCGFRIDDLASGTHAKKNARAAFVVVRVFSVGEPFAADAARRAALVATRPRAFVKTSTPARSPETGGGVLWVSGAELRSAIGDGVSQQESGPTWSALGGALGDARLSRSCVAVDANGGFAGAHYAPSSAVAACEIPPDPAKAFGFGGEASDATADGIWRVAYVAGGDVAGGDVAGSAGHSRKQTYIITPARGSVAGGTPVRVNVAAKTHPGWGGGGESADGARSLAGCFFGPVSVVARWSTASEVECVTPSRGITAASVRVAPVMDHRTRSFIAFGESYATFKYAMF